MGRKSRTSVSIRHLSGALAVLFALGLSFVANIQAPAHAAGNPPTHVLPAPAGGVNTLHGAHPGFKHGVSRTRPSDAKGAVPNGVSNPVYGTDPVIMVHGINGNSGLRCTAGLWGFPQSYLRGWHPGLGSDYITWTGGIYMIGYYNGDWNCTLGAYISTHNNPNGNFYAPACDGVATQDGGTVSNSDARVGTDNEPLEHVACELSWYIFYNWAQFGQNVKIVAHSMGGLIVRYMIEHNQAGDSHFAPIVLYISDVVTMSSPQGGIDSALATGQAFICGRCHQNTEMISDTTPPYPPAPYIDPFMADINSHDHPNAVNGTDWTMLGSLSYDDPLDWDYQATRMSNSGGLSNNHRIGYSYPITCNGQSEYPNGYGHGDYMNDQCDTYDAHYYYCDGCSRDKHTWFNYTAGAPHSLHEMLFALVYYNW